MHISKQSAGLLLFKKKEGLIKVLLVHPGGPFFKNKDLGVWSIPKGEYLDDEEPLQAAKREFTEETGQFVDGNFIKLKPVKLKSGKTVQAWAIEGDIDIKAVVSNFFEMEWPPKSGKMQSFEEVDRAGWFAIEEAKLKINSGQIPLLDELTTLLEK